MLTIFNAAPHHSGLWVCMAATSNTYRHIAHIFSLVVTTTISTEVAYQGDSVSFSCGATDLSIVFPSMMDMEWLLNDQRYLLYPDADLSVMD